MPTPRVDVRTRDGSVFAHQSLSDIQRLIDHGVVGPEDLARGSGSRGEWRTIATLRGLDWTRMGALQAGPSRSSGALLAVVATAVVLMVGGLVAAVVLMQSGSTEPMPGDGERLTSRFDGNADSAAAEPAPESAVDQTLASIEDFVAIQALVSKDLGRGLADHVERVLQGDPDEQVEEAELRSGIAGLLSRSTMDRIDRFSRDRLSESDRRELARIGSRRSRSPESIVGEWMVFETMLAYFAAIEVWSEELTIREIDPGFVASVGLIGNDTAPEFSRGIELVRSSRDRIVYRAFNGTYDFEFDAASGTVSGSAVGLRRAITSQSFESVGRPMPIRVSAEQGVLSSLLGDYIERFENQPWGREVISRDTMAVANIIIHDEDLAAAAPAQTGGFSREWHDRHHRAIPLMWMVDEDDQILGSGTGFVIERRGRWFVVTNRHVIDGAAKAMMVFGSTDDGGRLIESGPDRYLRVDRLTSEFKVHQYGNDIAVCDVTGDRDRLSNAGVVPLPIAEPDGVSPGARLIWFGHPSSDDEATDAESWIEMVAITTDLHRVTRGEAAVMKRETIGYRDMSTNSPWSPFESYVIITTGTIVSGNSGGPMIREEDGLVVGVCSAGRAQGDAAERNIGIRGRHVMETIDAGIRFNPSTMSNNGVETDVALDSRGVGAGLPDRQAVLDVCPQVRDWPLTDSERDWLDWAVTSGPDGGNWSPMYCTIMDLPANGTELDMHGWMRGENLDLRKRYWIFVSPEQATDIDLYGINSLGREVARDDGGELHASIRIEGVTGDAGTGTLRVHNHGRKSTRMLLLVCEPMVSDSITVLEQSCAALKNWPLTDAEFGWLSWAVRQDKDGGGWTPLHCEVIDLPAEGTNLEFEDWVRSQKLPMDGEYWVFVSPRKGYDIDLYGLNRNGDVLVKDNEDKVYASFRVDSVGGRNGVETLRVVNHDQVASQVLLILCQ